MLLTLATETQKALFEHELKGQFSDGYWENASPMNHWQVWCNATVVVGPNPGRSAPYVNKDNYGLTSKALLDIIGPRMLVLARLARHYTAEKANEIHELFFGGETEFCTEPRSWFNDERKAKMANYSDEERDIIQRIAEDRVGAYTMTDLKADLKAINQAMKTYVPALSMTATASKPTAEQELDNLNRWIANKEAENKALLDKITQNNREISDKALRAMQLFNELHGR